MIKFVKNGTICTEINAKIAECVLGLEPRTFPVGERVLSSTPWAGDLFLDCYWQGEGPSTSSYRTQVVSISITWYLNKRKHPSLV